MKFCFTPLNFARRRFFCKAPERLDAVDMSRFFRTVSGFADAKMPVAPNVHQSPAALPSVRMDNAHGRNPAPYDGLKRFGRAVVPVTGSAQTAPSRAWMPKTGCLSVPRPLFRKRGHPANPRDAQKIFINLNHAEYLFLSRCLMEITQAPENQKVPVHGLFVSGAERCLAASMPIQKHWFFVV